MLKRQFMQGKENIKGKVITLNLTTLSSDSPQRECYAFFGKPVNVNQLDISTSSAGNSTIYFQINNAWSYAGGLSNTTSVTIQNRQNVTGMRITSRTHSGMYTVTLTDCEYA